MSIYHELKFLNELVNTSNNDTEKEVKDFNNGILNAQNYLKKLNEKIMFTKVNVSELLTFINLMK